MRVPTFVLRKAWSKQVLFAVLCCILFLLLAIAWVSGRFAIGFRAEKTAHIFPTQVTATGWENPEGVLTQDLSAQANYVHFSRENSAFILLDAVPREVKPEVKDLPESEIEEGVATSTEGVTEENDDTEVEIIPSTQVEPNASSTETAPSGTVEGASTTENLPIILEEESHNRREDNGASSTAKKTAPLFSLFATPAFAAIAGEDAGDIAECVMLQVPCHTIEVSGFMLEGDLVKRPLDSVELRFSFASAEPIEALQDDMLVVRYYHDGVWRVAGELFLNKEMSNGVEGSYYSATLDEIEEWDDLSDVRVVVEFSDAELETPASVFLDAVWIAATYTDRLEDILNGESDELYAGENVSFSIADEVVAHDLPASLQLPDESILSFAFSDDVGEGLHIKADKKMYAARVNPASGLLESEQFVSVTNTEDAEDSFRLIPALHEGVRVRTIEQFFHNVPQTLAREVFDNVTYRCESGWQSDGERETCIETGETQSCARTDDEGRNCLVEDVVVAIENETVYESKWVTLDISAEGTGSIATPEGFRATSATPAHTILPGQTLFYRIVYESAEPGPLSFFLGAVGERWHGDLDSSQIDSLEGIRERVRTERQKRINEHQFETSSFGASDNPHFTFKFNSQRSFVSRLANRLIGRENGFSIEQALLTDESGAVSNVPFRATYGTEGEWKLELRENPRKIRPGKYLLNVTIKEAGETFTDTVEFYWGVLAINPNKSVYDPGEDVSLFIAALDEAGDTLCDADLELVITDPQGGVQSVPVRQSGECGPNNVIESADYLADYQAGDAGVYNISLVHFAPDGTVRSHVSDMFEVRDITPFSIERWGATRIWPVANYRMTLEVTAREDFEGVFVEAIPQDFIILDSGGAESEIYGGAKRLVWNLSLKAGESAEFSYVYDAPDISPYLYLLGPAEIRQGDGIPFSESRQWKLASDAVGNLLIYWDQVYVPTGWTCVSCAGGDAFYQRFIVGSSTPSVNGGATTHTHTATGAVGGASGGNAVNNAGGGSDIASITHTHTYSPIINAPSNLPPYRNLVILQANTTGEVQIPAGAIAIFDVASSSLPSGWFRYAAQDGRFTRGESAANRGVTGGSSTHTHTITGTTGNAVGGLNASGSGTNYAGPTHNHTVSSSTLSASNVPPYREALFARSTATSTAPDGMIGMWTGDTFIGWDSVSGPGGAFENRFVLASTTYGATGGSESHTHADVNGISPGAASGGAVSRQNTGTANGALSSHTHSINVTNFSTEYHLPPYRTAVFAKRLGGATPLAPSVHTPFESEKTGTSTPRIEFTASDPDGSDALVYQVQWDDDADLDVSPIGDRTSSSESGCSPNCFENTVTGLDTSPFNEGERIRFTIQSSLVSGTTYYFRVRSKDAGSTWGPWATTTSFTYVANTDPSQWLQTEDAQFEQGTLVDVETTGSDSVQILAADPVEALIAYGESAIQTPRYQIWDGNTWGGELSAQNVGGTIQWTITRAAPTRDEYVLGTQDALGDVNVQVYDGVADTWGDLQEVTQTISDITARGFDIAYESQSGDAVVVYCDGDADPSYYVWDGSNWTSGGTVNLALTNNCEYIKLASDPASDEIILVARDTAASATDYEALVWDGSAWGNSVTMGNMTDTLNEGIAVEYEESGNQVIVAVSNGNTNGFIWSAWDGVEWSVPTPQSLGDDFEWGILKRDVGSDSMALCYADEDDDLGVVRWDGSAWAATQEFDSAGNIAADSTVDGRPISCEFEITSGRDGYLMVPYSDTAAVRYQFMDDATGFNGEASLATIASSWTVGTVRTGDGTILMVAWDDGNTQYDVSSWGGSSWATDSTLEGSPSVTAEPYREPVHMSAQIFQPASGSITSDPISFSLVPGQPTWGEVLWNTEEPGGTDVLLQVLNGTGGTCGAVLTNAVLAGNEGGFTAAQSPLNLSGISTTTYTALCLRATLSSASQNNPELLDWQLSWERQPYLTQTNFRWYANAASALTPTDPWPSGVTDLNENDSIVASYAPIANATLRLRMTILTENVSLPAGGLTMKMQYAAGGTCTEDMAWFDVGGIGSTTAAWRGANNALLTDGATLPSVLLSGSDVSGTYEEENDSAVNPSGASAGQETEWDWVLQHNGGAGTNYCFRMFNASGEPLNEYDRYPSVVTNQKPSAPSLENPFDNMQTASTTPWFEFAGEDPESNDITYQIQIDDDIDFDDAPIIDQNSQSNQDDFSNTVTPADRDPFTSGQVVRYIPASALSNGTTYYWRVRGRDRNASNTWSDWSATNSVTVNTGTAITTWFQTTEEQFDTNTHEDTEPSASDDVILATGLTAGTTTGAAIDFDWKTNGNAWGELSWNDTETSSDIKYHLEYRNGSTWELIPEADLAGNAAGFDTSPVSLLGVDPQTYNEIRVRANLSDAGASPHLLDWRVEWGFAVSQPEQYTLFDNEKTGTTTPTFTFMSEDPDNEDLVYQISWSTTSDFTSSTTRESSLHAGFQNTASSTDLTPFVSGDTIRFTIQGGDALTNGTTYWWRVRARDSGGANVWSVWSPSRSLTVDTGVTVSTWFQTTGEQFETNELNDIEITGSDSVRITSTIREALTVYAEGTAQVPRYRLWNGTTWGTEGSAQSIGDSIRFIETAASPTRDEYVVATMGSTGVVDAQVYSGSTDTWGNITEVVAAVSDITQRGFDIAYETDSGDALAVACSGTEATYKVWNGTSWSASTAITLSVSASCEWVRLASDPASDEIIAVFRDATTGATDYQALVWNGSSWGNSMTMGSQVAANNEGIAIEYEESGGQAIIVVANGANNNFIWNSWNGSSWAGTNTVAIGNDFASARMCRDDGTDALAIGYIDIDNDIGYVLWDGAAWGTSAEFEATGNSQNGRPISCEFEVSTGRNGFIIFPYSDTIQAESVFWNGSILSGASVISTITDSWEVRSTRTGDGTILAVFYDDANTEYDFSYWNGSSWSAELVLDTTSISTFTPASVPLDIVARRYPTFTAGSMISSSIDFDDGLGLKWDEASWSVTTPGSSSVRLQVEYATSSDEWALVPDSVIPGNSVGTTTSPIDLGNVSFQTYNTLRLVADFTCVSGDCPTMQDWSLTWSPGLEISGTIKQYDQSTNVTSGTVGVAVNGVLQVGKTGAISGGAWTISNVTVFPGDVVTVFVDGAAASSRAVAVTSYDGTGDLSGLELFERHLTIGSNDNPTITNAHLALFDMTTEADVFHDVDGGNDLAVCATSGCTDAELWIRSGTTYRPDSSSSGNVSTHDIEINGTLVADGNTLTVSGSWDNNATFTPNSSTVVFSATSTTESIDSTGAVSSAFNHVTFGTSGAGVWNLSSPLDVNGNLTVNYGTLTKGTQALTIAGNLSIGANGLWSKGSATTTFDGASSATWSDASAVKQDIGIVAIDGSAKTVQLGSNVRATDIVIGADDTLNASSGNYGLEVLGNWTNQNAFVAMSGTVTFAATTTGKTIVPGNSNFHNLTFDGVGGNWAFSGNVTANNNVTIANGIVTLPVGTTTVGGNFTVSGGSFMHNNGVVLLNAGSAKTIQPSTISFYDLVFNGSGSWTFPDGSATSSRHTKILAGTVTLPSNALAVGGSFTKSGGSFVHNSGTIRFTASSAQSVRLGNSDAYNLTFTGSGSWSFTDTNATSTNTVRIESGTLTLPSGVLAVGGSWLTVGGAFTHNSGTVKFNSADTGETIQTNGSWFSSLLFDSAGGGWTIAESATSTASTTIARAASFTLQSGQTLSVGGAFVNGSGGATTTWTGSTLYLYSGNRFAINTKTGSGDVYGTLAVAANTDVKMWNSEAITTTVDQSSSLYSQDHAAVDGDLFIWGEYLSNGNEYWSYANDFDGTALGVSSRQVDVRFSANASLTHATGTLEILGAPTASTTIAHQGSGTYALRVVGGTLDAEYYSIRNTNADGLYLFGSVQVTSLADGDFELGQNGGSMVSLAGSVIDANPALEIERVSFATSSGITSGYNVSATTSATSYWWFRNHSGNYAGENFDNDLGGNPGYVRFEDSSFSITVSGTVYADRGVTEMSGPTCDDVTPVVRIIVNGTTAFSGSCDSGDGSYSIPNVLFSGDAVLTAYLDTNGGPQAVTVTRTPTGNISGLDLYAHALITRHESTSALGIAHLALFDSSDDSDIFFAASSSLVVAAPHEIYVWSGSTFTPGGNVSIEGGGTGNSYDGRLHLAPNATYRATGNESHAIGGDFIAESGAVYVAASSTLSFTATTSREVTLAPALTFWNVAFTGSGGSWNLSGATTTVSNSFTVDQGELRGTGNVLVSSGSMTGNGSIAMSAGTVSLRESGNFGGNSAWQFYNLTLGDASSTETTTKIGTGTTTVLAQLRIASNHTLSAGSSGWNLAGSSTPLMVQGLFDVDTAPFYFTASGNTTIADETYAQLVLAPASAGSPLFTIMGGTLTAEDLTVGGAHPVTVTIDTNDPTLIVTDDLEINPGSTLVASNVGAFEIGGSWTNAGTFTHSGGTVLFESADVGETITPGVSSFYDIEFDNAGGGWTILANATSTRHFELTNAASFTVDPGVVVTVGGTFTNAVGGGATTWTGSTLALRSGTSYTANTKTAGGDIYGTLLVASSTDIRFWHSSSTAALVASGSSLYSQDHASVDGDLYVWGDYEQATGNEYWSYDTDFDGTSLGGSSRQVDVRIASSSTITLSGGVLDILGGTAATTTIDSIGGSGVYTFAVTGGTLNAQRYSFRHLGSQGLTLSGSPTITSLSDGDFELSINGGSLITVAGTVIDANPLKILMRNRFATSSGITTGTNVTATGVSASSWKFNLHYGDIDGENFDVDPTGDPGYLRWDDSATQITIAGSVYSDEGTSVSAVCDGSTPVVRLMVQGVSFDTASCDDVTGEYSISDILYNPGDSILVYLDTNGGVRAANVSVDPNTNITTMHLYENRTIVRHEDTTPITISDMALYDSDQDSDVPFDAEDSATDTLTLPPENKLIVWTGKTFAPAGNVTVQSGGSGSDWDGTLEVQAGATFSAASTQTHSVGGSLLVASGGSISPAQSTFTLTATTTGKTIQPSGSSFYNLTFNGSGGNWAFLGGSATTTNDFTISNGTVTLPTGRLTIGGSFQNTGGTTMHNNGTMYFSATAAGETVRLGGSNAYALTFAGTGGAWTMQDTNATSSNAFRINAGAVTLPAGTLAVGDSFVTATTSASFTHASGSIRLTATSGGKILQGSSSNFNNLLFAGSGGEWVWNDTSSSANTVLFLAGSTTLPVSLTVTGSFENSGGSFSHNNGTVIFAATGTGRTIRTNGSWFNAVTFNSASGGWTLLDSATSTGAFSLSAASSFTLSSGATLRVEGVFTNAVGGAATTWTGSTLLLSGATSSVNTKAQSGDVYDTLEIGANTDVRMWHSSAGTTTVNSSGSLYSQDHAAVDGSLSIWGEYLRESGADYWSYATDFDGAALGSPRRVYVRIASSSSVTYAGGELQMVGSGASTTDIRVQGSGAYSFAVSGGTLNANGYEFRNLDASGLTLSGTPAITSLDNGSFELSVSGGSLITVAASVIDANASKVITGVAFATSSGVSAGYNVKRTGSPVSAWNFDAHSGNYDGESFDDDGGDGCGSIRWDDSACLFVSQEHYRFRADDGGEGAPNSAWFDVDWSKRKRLTVANPTAEALTNVEVRVDVTYDADMQADFDDLRFTNETGTTTIDYWIEEYTASATSTVWLEIPNLPASGQAIVYMYYGNASVLTTGDGEATFDFFDDFEDDDISEYSGNTTLFNVGTDFNYRGTYGLDAFGDEDQKTTGGIYQTGSLFGQNSTIRYFQYVDVTAGAEDSPCALFAVQGSAQNYAVCLNLFETDKVFISENAISNESEGAGTVLASTTVSFTETGWYEVVIDWLDSDTIDVTVYDPSDAEFATVSVSDSSYSSGGMGFTYWLQHGGWDFYSVRQYFATEPSYVFSVEQTSGGATWLSTEDTLVTVTDIESNIRLRFSIQNTGSDITDATYRLQVAAKGASLSCEAVPHGSFEDVPLSNSCGSSAACMAASGNFTDGALTTELLSSPATLSFVQGSLVEDLSNQSPALDVGANRLTEVEYNFQMTGSAVDNAYCFRVSEAGVSLANYERVAELQMVHAPFITNWSLNNGNAITLTEGVTTTVSATGTITDFNGYSDITVASSTIYRSGVGSTCTSDENNCYRVASCSLSACSGNSCTISCTAPIQYHADPTDAGTYIGDTWAAWIQAADSSGLLATESSLGVELLSLYGLTVNANIAYDPLYPGESSTTTEETIVANTGNTNINLELEGTNIGSIDVSEQAFATSTFVYASCSICEFLTGVGDPTPFDVDLPKPTSTSTPVTDEVYWGINIPNNSAAGTFQGTNTFWATGG